MPYLSKPNRKDISQSLIKQINSYLYISRNPSKDNVMKRNKKGTRSNNSNSSPLNSNSSTPTTTAPNSNPIQPISLENPPKEAPVTCGNPNPKFPFLQFSGSAIAVVIGAPSNETTEMVTDEPPPPPDENDYECLTPSPIPPEELAALAQSTDNNNNDSTNEHTVPPDNTCDYSNNTYDFDGTTSLKLISRTRINNKGKIIKLPLKSRKGEALCWKHMAFKNKIRPIPLNRISHRS
uniref:Uncharacterized protein n=1 Tax=Meloidogyne enterolobii TaxID=390850 RepID=A0A6V7VPA3_MELEN|nr:unnamed protein product [Meloidogyne enterolobii]